MIIAALRKDPWRMSRDEIGRLTLLELHDLSKSSEELEAALRYEKASPQARRTMRRRGYYNG